MGVAVGDDGLGRRGVRIRGARFDQFHRDHGSASAHITDDGHVLLQTGEGASDRVTKFTGARHQVAVT